MDSNKMETWSAKVLPDTKNNLSKILNDDFSSANAMLEVFVERYNNPKKADEENIRRIQSAESMIKKLDSQLAEKQTEIDVLKEEKQNWDNHAIELQKECNELKEKIESIESIEDNALIIKIDAVKRRLLEWIADREGKARNKVIPIDVMVMFIIDEIMIKGNKYAFNSVPDSIINNIKKEVGNVNA